MFSKSSPNDNQEKIIQKETENYVNSEEKFQDETTEENTEFQLLCLSESPIYFEPISQLTNVFFDRDNQQIFCVRSNGVGGVIVKGSKPDLSMSFRMEDKGNVATIKFSLNMSILAIRRKDKCVIDFLNFKNSQPVFPEYSQTFKAKTSKFQECYWLDNTEILLVSEQGFEHYQVFPEKRALKLIKFFSMPLNWLIWSREAQSFIVSTGVYGSVLNPFVNTKGGFLKLPKFEVDLPLPLNLVKYRYNVDSNSSNINSNRYYLNESDVVVGKIYNEFYVMIIRQMSQSANENDSSKLRKPSLASGGFSEIAMYKLLTDSPAKKTNILKINLAGRFTLNIIDELVIVHHRTSYSSMIFDIKIPGEFDGYTTCNFPIIKKACIQSTEIPLAHSLADTSHSTRISSSPTSSSSSTSASPLNEMYSMNWIMFLPNVIIDAKLGCFWYMQLNLKNGDLKPFAEFGNDYFRLVEFLLNRKNTKQHLLNVCELAIQKKSSLKIIEKIFEKINEFYKFSLILFPSLDSNDQKQQNESQGSLINNSSQNQNENKNSNNILNEKNELPVIEQYDMHNYILYPMLEDETWWSNNSKYSVSVIIEYFRSLNVQQIPIEHFLYKLLVNALIKSNRLYQLHQYLQYHVLLDSKPLACLLLSIQSKYPASNQIALDMLKRLGTANEEIVDVLLSQGLILSALRFGIQMGLSDNLNPGKFLETAKDLNDPLIYHEVFKFFEERNIRLRGNPNFRVDENCESYVKHFMTLFQNNKTNKV